METFPVLNTNRLNLVEIDQTYASDILNLYSNKDVTRFYNLLPIKSIEESSKVIEYFKDIYSSNLGVRWGLILKGRNELIGTLGFNHILDHHKASIGYDLHPNYWKNGYIIEALKAIVNFGFYDLALNRIEAEIMVGNVASERVITNIDFNYEGTLKHWMFWNNHYYDMKMYALLRSEYKNPKNTIE